MDGLVWISRKAALARGLGSYFTSIPCKAGHIAERRTIDRSCRECKRGQYRARYRRKSAEMNAYHKARREADPEMIRARDRAAYHANRDAALKRAATYRANNPEKVRAAGARWQKQNPEKRAATQRNREARAAHAGVHTAAEIAEIKYLQRNRCGYCRVKLGDRYHVDHIKALARGGTNDRRNLQILCVACNQAKRTHDPIDYARMTGRLI